MLVGRVGFEPTTNWLKANCSTTELTTHNLPVQTVVGGNGGSCRIRTYDQLVKSQLLYH